MKNIAVITKAVYVSGKILELTFSDGIKANIDFSKWIEKYPFFSQLRDADYFRQFSLDGWTVSWPNGADIAPETLHEIATKSQHRQSV